MSDEIEKLFIQDKPYSFGGQYRLYNNFTNKKKVDEALSKSDTYTRFLQHKKARRYSPIYVYRPRELWQSDVVFFTNKEYVDNNNGYKYILTIIDAFTKYAYAYPMKENKCEKVLECFKDVFQKCGKIPERLNTDRGSELTCKNFENFLKKENVYHYLSYSLRKCPIVERFNLTLQRLLYQMMNEHHTTEWTKYLDQALKIYNSRYHRTIKMSPIEAEKPENETKVRRTFYEKYRKANSRKQKPKFQVNDEVRIFTEKGKFDCGYDAQFSREHFKIKKVLNNLPVVRYVLSEYDGRVLPGNFFQDELVKYVPSEYYPIEVKNKRKKGKKTQYLVHYIGWQNKWDTWVNEEDMIDL